MMKERRINTRNSGFVSYIKTLSVLLVCFLGYGSNAYAQSGDLQELLEKHPEKSGSELIVYTYRSKTEVASVDFSKGYTLVNSNSNWSIIKFNVPTVPLWVSADFVEQKDNTARVTVSRLNVRLLPNVNSLKVTHLSLNYKSLILDSRNGFVQILAPANTLFSVNSESLKKLPSSISVKKEVQQSNSERNQKTVPESPATKPVSVATGNTSLSFLDSQKGVGSHIIAPGDAISLLVFGEPDLSIENIRVPESGRVSLPLIGSVVVGGQTTKQVEDSIRDILASGYVNNPRLSVSIFSYRPIFIRGAVDSTGAFPFSEGLSIAKAIALAGGGKNSAKENGVSILRDGVLVQEALSLDSQYQVVSGDVITVAEEQGISEDESLFIYMHGEVANPGEYRYRRGLTVEKAIVLAGGFTLRASRKRIKITRYIDVEDNNKPVKLKNVELYTTIMPGDIISVKASLF